MLVLRELHPLFGAEIAGLQLGSAVSDEEASAVRDAVHSHGIVLLRDQRLSDEAFRGMFMRWGDLQRVGGDNAKQFYGSGTQVSHLTNVAADGSLMARNDRRRGLLDANLLWHTDGTYVTPRAAISGLLADVVPPTGGNTEYCDTRIAYEALSEKRKQELTKLQTRHSLIHSRAQTGFTQWSEEERALFAPVTRPLVHFHRESGRKALILASHILDVVGMPEEQGRELISDLIALATQPERVYSHIWRVGDLLLWDNRCTMHRARPYEEFVYPRDMRSIRTVDLVDS